MVVGCWGPRQQGRTSSSDYVTPVTAVLVRGCTPDCLRKPVTGRHPSDRGDSSLPSSTRVRKRVARLPSANTLSFSAPSSRYRIALPAVLRSRPPSRPNQPSPSTTTLLPLQEPRTHGEPPPPPPRVLLSYAATAITFAGKSSGAVRVPGLTLQGVVRGATVNLPFSHSAIFSFFFFTFSFVRKSKKILSRKSIR